MNREPIPFNRPYVHGREMLYMAEALRQRKLAGDGGFTKRCHALFEQRYGFAKTLLTTSCSDALELAALLLDIRPADEVIVPSFTFVSTANAFALRGAKIVFADSSREHPNIDPAEIERLMTPRTRAVAVVHYAGVACDMDRIVELCRARGVPLVEDAAQAIDAFHRGRPLGSLGTFGTFSFHETKNIVCGEGGLLAINDLAHAGRAEILREKGTNRSAFFRGEVDKYGWVDVGSSFLPSDMLSAYLFAQLELIDEIQSRRKAIWQRYRDALAELPRRFGVELPALPDYATNNAHMFYLVCSSLEQRTELIARLKERQISAPFHYVSLHSSSYFHTLHDGRPLPNADRFTEQLVRLPLYAELSNDDVDRVCEAVLQALG